MTIQSFYARSRACVTEGSEVSEWFPVTVGLSHCCVMSNCFFPCVYCMGGMVGEVNSSEYGLSLAVVGASGRSWQSSPSSLSSLLPPTTISKIII